MGQQSSTISDKSLGTIEFASSISRIEGAEVKAADMADNSRGQKRSANTSDLPLARKPRRGPDLGPSLLRPRKDARPGGGDTFELHRSSDNVRQGPLEVPRRQDSVTSEADSDDSELLRSHFAAADMHHDRCNPTAESELQPTTDGVDGEQERCLRGKAASIPPLPLGAATSGRYSATQAQTNSEAQDRSGSIGTQRNADTLEQGHDAAHALLANQDTPRAAHIRGVNDDHSERGQGQLQSPAQSLAAHSANSGVIDVDG